MKGKFKEIIMPTLILGAVCLISASAVVGVNAITRDSIREAQTETAERTRKIVLSDAQSFEEAEGYIIGMDGSDIVGYVFETEAKGYGGTIKVMTGILKNGTVGGVAILEHNETPGLGANAQGEEFRAQYQQDISRDDLELTKDGQSSGRVEAITGATITSRAVTGAVNKAAEMYRRIEEGGAP